MTLKVKTLKNIRSSIFFLNIKEDSFLKGISKYLFSFHFSCNWMEKVFQKLKFIFVGNSVLMQSIHKLHWKWKETFIKFDMQYESQCYSHIIPKFFYESFKVYEGRGNLYFYNFIRRWNGLIVVGYKYTQIHVSMYQIVSYP